MHFLKPDWPAPHYIRAYTTLRHSWGEKQQIYTNKNQEDRNSRVSEIENMQLKALLNLPEKAIWLTQTHSSIAIEARPEHNNQIADASYTSQPTRVCAVLTADCLPLLVCNQQGTHVAAIHAGWRGLASGIIESTLLAFPPPFHDLLIWLGPAIGQQKFEVGQDVFDAFTRSSPISKTAFLPYTEGKWLANLYHLAKIRLNQQGITQIYGGDFCTYTQDDMFFSYRRDHGMTGRMASLIWIDKD